MCVVLGPHSLFLLLSFSLFVSPSLCASFSVFSSDSSTPSTSYTFAYSTLSSRPHETQNYTSITYLTSQNISNCDLTNVSDLTGHLVIYPFRLYSYSLFQGCVTDNVANTLMLAVAVQNRGAAGILIPTYHPEQDFYEGRFTGFSSKVKIPVLVVRIDAMKKFYESRETIEYVVVPPMEPSESDTLDSLHRTYLSLLIVNGILFGIALLLLGYLLYIDLISLSKKQRFSPFVIILKITAFLSSFLYFLFNVTDPFSYKQKTAFKSFSVFILATGILISLFVMILLIWAKTSGDKKRHPKLFKVVTYMIYTVASVEMIVTIVAASKWEDERLQWTYFYVTIAATVISDIGYLYYGQIVITTMCASGRINPGQKRLPIRIAAFIAIFVVLTTIGIALYASYALGVVINSLVVEFMFAFVLLFTFLVLFFRRIHKEKRKIPVSTSKNSSSLSSSEL